MFGSSHKQPAPPQKPLGADVHRITTSEQARPVPYLAGKQRIALTFISDVFDQRVQEKTQTVGKQKSKIGYNYYASFAAAACHGPVRALYDVYLNGDPVYASTTVIKIMQITRAGIVATAKTKNAHGLSTNDVVIVTGATAPEYNGQQTVTVTSSTTFTFSVSGAPASENPSSATFRVRLDPVVRDDGHPDFVDITIPDYGVMRLYWGTEDQPPDRYLQTSSHAHPAYTGICYAVFHQLFLGFNQTNVQNVELVLSRYPEREDWFSERDVEDESNPVSVAIDLLQNPRAGLALSDERIDKVATVATADALDEDSLSISPILTRSTELRQLLGQTFEYFDGYRDSGDGGKLAIRRLLQPGDDVLEVTDADLLARPELTPEDWSTVATDTNLKFTNREFGYKEDMAKWRDAGAHNIVEDPSTMDLDRSWVTRPALAQSLVRVAGRAAAIPRISGRLRLRWKASLFDTLTPAAPFKINHSPRNLSALIFRVIDREIPDPAKPEFVINFENDRTYLQYVDAPHTDVAAQHAFTAARLEAPSAAENAAIIELPPGLSGQEIKLTALVARSDIQSNGFAIFQAKDYNNAPESYTQLSASDHFAKHGALCADYPADTQTIDLLQGVIVQLDGIDTELDSQTNFDALADALLLFIGEEVMSVNSVKLLAPGLYHLMVTRERFGSLRAAHATGSEVWIIERSGLVELSHPSFQVGNIVRFKLAPQNPAGQSELGDIEAKSLTISGKLFEQLRLSNLRVNGKTSNPSYSEDEPLVLDWSLAQIDGAFLLPDRYTVRTRLDFLRDTDFPPTATELETPDELTLVGTRSVEGNSLTLPYSSEDPEDENNLLAILGSATDFAVIARREVEGPDFKKISAPQFLLVTKV